MWKRLDGPESDGVGAPSDPVGTEASPWRGQQSWEQNDGTGSHPEEEEGTGKYTKNYRTSCFFGT